ncbi:putative aldouronate transport system substrate-binding protein [Paenibacillus rhizosphaerae]|uniref:Putative aldouronate transport system substrate-binding protein n=1 Tax=Paenibacillus rhizosphaerae TaxID=297318 RepID=A0A839TKX0_9BACL|nr:extracellular solute-binding protein [Paenibacillus rhizosphaerae]MBB3125477.1 putative aldouronate transport system substrate-binding protein [Paenibacillus rhizosphaerae]
MKTKKWFILPVIAGLLLTSTACGSDRSNDAASTASSEASAASPASKPELRALVKWIPEGYEDHPIAQMLEEKTGYKVKYDMLPVDKPEDKLNLLIASSEPYDTMTIGGSNKALYADYAQKGALVDLTPLIDKYGPNIKASVSQESLDAVKVNGKIYAIPTRSIEYAGTSLMIRKDWLDKLHLQVPTTLDELTTVLKEFKDKDPGGNGDKNIPITIKGDAPMVDNIVGAFGVSNAWNDVDGKLVPRVMDPAYKDYLSYMNDLYKEGLLDPEFAVNKDATVKEKFTNGMAGVIPLHWADIPTIADALKKNIPDAEYVYVPALKGKNGKAGLAVVSGFDSLTFVPKASKHPEDAIKWINAKLEPETFKDMSIGVEGVHYNVKDGVYTPILPKFDDERGTASNFHSGIDEKNYPVYWQVRVHKDQRLYEGWEYLNKEQPAEVYFSNPLGIAPYFPNFSKNSAKLGQMENDYSVKVIVGQESLSGLDSFVAKYKAAGADASYKEINDWYATKKK